MITKKTSREEILKLANDCEKCGHCCSYDSGIFLDEDIKRIAKKFGMSTREFEEHYLEKRELFNRNLHKAKKPNDKPYGKCVFLKDGLCSIHDIKPLNCLLGSGCHEHGQDMSIWFMLNHIVDSSDPEAIRQWAQYLKTHPTIPGGSLTELVPDQKKLQKIMDYSILK